MQAIPTYVDFVPIRDVINRDNSKWLIRYNMSLNNCNFYYFSKTTNGNGNVANYDLPLKLKASLERL